MAAKSKMKVKKKQTAPQMTTHGGLKKTAPKAPSGYGVRGMKSVADGAVRDSTAPTPRTLGGRDY